MLLSFILAVCFYLGGLLLSLVNARGNKESVSRAALWILGAGFFCHSLSLVSLAIETRRLPVYSSREAFCFFSWLVTLSFFISYLRYRIKILVIFVLPLVSVFMLIAGSLDRQPLPPGWGGYWVHSHMALVLIAYSAFFLTFVASILYLLQEHALKSKRLEGLPEKLPSLQTLDRLLVNSLLTGIITMTLGILTGAIWAERVWGGYWRWDPKEIAALVTWLIYLFLIHCRLAAGWRGKRAAIVNVIGFISVLFTFLGASYFRGLHAF